MAGRNIAARDGRHGGSDSGTARADAAREGSAVIQGHVRGALWLVAGLGVLVSPTPGARGAAGTIRFESPSAAAVGFTLENAMTPDKPMIGSVLGGLALLDYDQDGFLDIYFTNGAAIPSLAKSDSRHWNRLYHNNRDGTFSDVTERAGVAGTGYDMGVAAGDYDNDGYPDLFVAGVNHNTLYRNNRDGTFADVTREAGVTGVSPAGKKPWSVGAAWLDYDKDGKLDLFVSNYLDWSFETARTCGPAGQRVSCSPTLYRGLPNTLFRNNGDGTFADVSVDAGISRHIGKGMGLAVADFDADGWIDVFVANDKERNFLFHNLGGRRFDEKGLAAGIAYTEDGVPASNMGVDFRDLNDDGRPDLVSTALPEETFSLRLNTGRGFFEDATYQSGLGLATAVFAGWSVGAYDFDNDGDKDLFTSNSHVIDNVDLHSAQRYRQRNAVFENIGAARFVDATKTSGTAMQVARAHRGAAFGDLDNDGRVDVVVSAIGEPAVLLLNASEPRHHWLLLKLIGRGASNRDAIGARITLTSASGRVQYNHVTTSVGYASSSDRRVHFGLGADASVREIQIVWPSGKVQTLGDVKANQVLEVAEP